MAAKLASPGAGLLHVHRCRLTSMSIKWRETMTSELAPISVSWYLTRENLAEVLTAATIPLRPQLRDLTPSAVEHRIRSELQTYGPSRVKRLRTDQSAYQRHVMEWARKQVAKL